MRIKEVWRIHLGLVSVRVSRCPLRPSREGQVWTGVGMKRLLD